jgi:hypothetical protein
MEMRWLNISKMIYLLGQTENLLLMGNNNGVDVVSLPVNQGSLIFNIEVNLNSNADIPNYNELN